MKKLIAGILALTLVTGVLSSCSSGTTTSQPDTSSNPNNVTNGLSGEITWWAFPTFSTTYAAGEYEQQMVNAFQEKNPGVKINVEMIDFTSGPEKIVSAIQGGTAPDVLFDAPGRIVDYGKNGKLANLNDMFTSEMKNDVNNENILDACSDGQNYWMYPLSSAPFTMAVNKTILEKEGLMDMVPTTGDRTWTTEEYTKLNEALKAKGYKNSIVFASGQGGDQGSRAFVSNLYSSSITNEDLTEYTINNDNGVKALEYVYNQVKAGNIENGSAFNGGEAIEQFVSGAVTSTLLWAPVNAINNKDTMSASNVEALALPLPSDDGVPELEYLVNGFCVFDNNDDNKVAISKEFIKFLCDDSEWGPKNVVASKAFPVRQSFGNLYPGDSEMEFYASMSKYYSKYYNTIDGFATMRPAWFSNLQALMIGDKNAKKAADDFVLEANESIIKNKK